MTDFSMPYRALSPAARIAALAYGVVHPHARTPAQMSQVLKDARFKIDGKLPPPIKYRVACTEVLDSGILKPFANQGRLMARDSWAPWLTIRAMSEKRLFAIERAFEKDRLDRLYGGGERYHMKLRCNIVAGRRNQLPNHSVEPEDLAWLAYPGAGHLLGKLPAKHLANAVQGCMDRLLEEALDPEPVVAAWFARKPPMPGIAAEIAFILLMQGRWDDALAVFDDLPADVRETKTARAALASTRALTATLKGDDDEALAQIDAAIAIEKEGTRKRNIFFPFRSFIMSLLSLVRAQGPQNFAKLEHLLRVGDQGEPDPTLFSLVASANRMQAGGNMHWTTYCRQAELDRLIDGLHASWLGDFKSFGRAKVRQYAGDDRWAGLCDFTFKAADAGYQWVAAECLEVAGRIEKATRRRMDRVEVDGREMSPAAAAAALHEDLGTTTLASLVAPMPDWEYALQGIEQLAFEASKKKPGKKKASAPPGRRLAWIMDSHERLGPLLTAKEQRGYKNGKWSKGRSVSLKKLRAEGGSMSFLSDQDRAAAGSIVENRVHWNGLPAYYVPKSGVYALAGHPHVFTAEGAAVEIVRRDPELVLDERGDVLRARVEPHGGNGDGARYGYSMPNPLRCEVTHFTKGHMRLCRMIPADGLEVPLAAKDRLVEAVAALAGEILVQGALADAGEAARRIDADPAPWVQLEPKGPGLTAALLVEPVPESGSYFPPGVGGTSVFGTVGGESVRAQRDLAEELRRVDMLMRECPMLGGIGPNAFLNVADPADCLELVDQLEAAKARCLWPKGQPFRVVARTDTPSLRLSVKSAADWFSASGELDIDGDRAIDLRRLFELMDRSPAPRFVELGDGAFVSLTSSFHRQLEDLRGMSAPRGKKQVRLHRLAASALPEVFEAAELSADAGWEAHRRAMAEARTFEPEIPSTLQAELRPYQEDGFRWLSRLSRWGAGACLADDMGLGKTVQTLALLLERGQEGPALVVAPTSVVANWLDEARRFAPTLGMRSFTGLAASRAKKLEGLGPFDVVVTTYGLLHIETDALAAIDWSVVVLDEAQAIKNPATKRARAARKLKAEFRMVTTGTPIQNNLVDLYSIFAFANPGLLGSLEGFRGNFAAPVERGDPAARARLRRLIGPFVLRRLKAEVLDDLPPRTEVVLHVEMSPEEAALYEALRLRAVADLDALARDGLEGGGEHRLQVLAHLTRLRLACCNPRLVREDGPVPASSKLQTFATTLDELRQGRHKVLVFSQFVRHLKLVEEHLVKEKIPYQYLDGSTPARQRAERIAAFQAGRGDVFLISLKAGGVGLNLTAADYVIHMDPWWNPAAEDQASDRAHRIGQTRPVTIYRLVAKGTIEEQIVELHRHKRELADRLLEGADAPGKLSTEELLGLLRGDGAAAAPAPAPGEREQGQGARDRSQLQLLS